MRFLLVIASVVLIGVASLCIVFRSRDHYASASVFSQPHPTAKPDFESDIKPIFQARCQPCHFQGGQVYEKMPFDKAQTISRLGTKLFTRIKDDRERRLIQDFLDASKDSK